MEKYILYYGIVDDELLKESFDEFATQDEATDAAYKLACAEYDLRPERTIEQIMEEDDCSREEALEQYEMDREDYIDWFAEVADDEDEDEDEDEVEEEDEDDPFDEDDE